MFRSSRTDRKSTRLNSSHLGISYAVFCLKKKKNQHEIRHDAPPEGLHRQHIDEVIHGEQSVHGVAVINKRAGGQLGQPILIQLPPLDHHNDTSRASPSAVATLRTP